MAKRHKVDAKNIIELLEAKHWKDIGVSECKLGPSMGVGGKCRRLDYWACKKSWANCLATGYEIKVSRSDFLGDEKWVEYLKSCHQFYFVCPSGLIQPEELPDKVGLMYVSQTGTRLFTKRKAVIRDLEIPNDLLLYILMWRTKILTNSQEGDKEYNKLEYWRQWLAERKEGKELGYRISWAITSHVEAVERENKRLKGAHKEYADLLAMCKELGVDPRGWKADENLRQALTSAVTPELQRSVSQASKMIQGFEATIEKLKSGDTTKGTNDGNNT